MTRSAWTLAALADAALPGLHPVAVEEVVDRIGDRFRLGFVEDTRGHRWVVRVPAEAVAAAQQEESVPLLALLAPRLPFEVPRPVGFAALRDGRRAMTYPYLPGRSVRFDALPTGPGGLATSIGAGVAAVHDLDRALFEEAGMPAYEADDCRRRHQADVDRGARTGLVPTALLSRWERLLDDGTWWRFAPTPTHGHLTEEHVLVVFDDIDDASRGHLVGLTSWEKAHIGDPAEDLASIVGDAPPEAVTAVLHAYRHARADPPDVHLHARAHLLYELAHLTGLLSARRLGDRRHVTQATETLRRLDDAVSDARGTRNRGATDLAPLSVDFAPAPVDEQWYQAGSPVPPIEPAPADLDRTAVHGVGASTGSSPVADRTGSTSTRSEPAATAPDRGSHAADATEGDPTTGGGDVVSLEAGATAAHPGTSRDADRADAAQVSSRPEGSPTPPG